MKQQFLHNVNTKSFLQIQVHMAALKVILINGFVETYNFTIYIALATIILLFLCF